jgi:hypothetical protein
MRVLQVVGILIGLSLGGYGVYKYRGRRYGKLDLLVNLSISIGLLVISLNPAIGDIPARLLGMQTRWFAVLFVSNVVLLGLFYYTLNRANRANRAVGELVRALAKAEYHKTFAFEKNCKSIFIVIPAYNEERAIAGVLSRLPQTLLGYEVHPIVVVDGASDNTEQVVRRASYVVASHAINRGQGDALRTGFEIALSEGADIVMTMDGDGQHRVEDMEKLVRPIVEGEADYVMGSRFLGEYEDRGGLRHVGIVLFTTLINFLARVQITDCTNGFRAIRGTDLAELDLREDRFNAPELIMEAAKAGLRITEVPVTIARRSAGSSKKPPSLGYPVGFLRTIVKVWLR